MESGDELKGEIKIQDEKIFNNNNYTSILSLCLKIYLVLVCLFLFSTQINWTYASVFDWIWPNRNYFNGYQTGLPAVPFEISESNDRFITDTSKVLGIPLSEIDFCQQRVILSLKSNCKTLTGDELGKVTIALLNCKNLAESHPTIECTESMNLGLCIGQMSPGDLQVYNQIFTRTKTMCLAIRQEQFRGMAELTVNRLVDSAHQHLGMVERLKNSHNQLEKATLNSIEEVTDNQINLMEKQQELLKIVDTQRIIIESNLKEMQREKNFIRSGQIELTAFMANLKQKFNEGLTEIYEKNTKAKEIFEELFDEIAKLNSVSDKIAIRLETVSQMVFDKNRETSQQFQNTLVKLKDANNIVHNFSNILETIKRDFTQQFDWLDKYMTNKESLIPPLSVVITHIVYLVVGMIFMVFINSDNVSRFIFLSATVINFVAIAYKHIGSNMILLTETICFLLLAHRLSKFLNNYMVLEELKLKFNNNINLSKIFNFLKMDDGETKTFTRSSLHKRETIVDNNNNDGNSYEEQQDEVEIRSPPPPRESFIRAPSVNIRLVREETPSERRSITPQLDMGKCRAVTRSGLQCQFMTPSLSADYCRIHERLSMER